jgi:DNA-binding NarL/FixJ family response regulator
MDDMESARLELGCARDVFEQVGAQPDVMFVDAICAGINSGQPKHSSAGNCGLTTRELQVLRLIATGITNKALARELSLSEKTIDRHVSNIFVKVDVSSRAAATAYAYDHGLL